MKLEAGKAATRPLLPPAAGAQESYVLETPEDPSQAEGKRSPMTADLADRIAAEADDASRIAMPPAGRWHSALIPFRNCVLERVNAWQQEEKNYEASQAKKTLRSRREPSMDGYRWKSLISEGSYLFPSIRL